jgi:hypothetical protein
MKIARLVIYEGSEEWIKYTLARSLSEGFHEMGGLGRFITVIQLDATPIIEYLNPRRNKQTFEEIDK